MALRLKPDQLQETFANGEIVIRKIPRAINCADALTHPWGSGDNRFGDAMSLIYIPSIPAKSASVRPSATYALMRKTSHMSSRGTSMESRRMPDVPHRSFGTSGLTPDFQEQCHLSRRINPESLSRSARKGSPGSSLPEAWQYPPRTWEGTPRSPASSRVPVGHFEGTALVRRLPSLSRADFGAGRN